MAQTQASMLDRDRRPWIDRARARWRLARWLGPWTRADQSPLDVSRRALVIAPEHEQDRPIRAWVYQSERRRPRGSLLLIQGLHYAGPSDPRMDRFARILASSGALVFAPFVPDFERMVLANTVFRDVERSLAALLALPERPSARAPSVMSISFGSLPALHLASTPALAREIATLILFGGYADLGDTLRFCLEGDGDAPHDPLNRPVVFMNLVSHLGQSDEDARALMTAWREFVTSTWGQPELKQPGRAAPIARAIADRLPPNARPLFMQTVGLEPGAMTLLERALARGREQLAWLDPIERARAVRVPTYVLHGADDDVIPHRHAQILARTLPAQLVRGVYVTGLYGHTGAASAPWHDARALAKEARTLVGALSALADAATR